jgi:hypothetical protein
MKKNNKSILIVVAAGLLTVISADPVTINQVGVGARAYSLANNYVALSNDMSSVFWNPAALSFLPVREFQAAFDVLDNQNETDLFGFKDKSDVRRMRLSSIGFFASLPASRGGLTFAGTLQSPFVFDETIQFKSNYPDVADQNIKVDQYYKAYGSLTYISGAFGLQVAPGFGVGLAISLVTGTDKLRWIYYKLTDNAVNPDSIENHDFDYTQERSNLGYDCRLGLLYSVSENIRLGVRLALPQQIWFDENASEIYPHFDSLASSSGTFTGQLLSSYSGAVGVAVKLPYLTITSEARARAPYDLVFPDEQIPASSPAAHVKMGAGLGLEAPLFNTKFVARCGYSWDQYDPFIFVRKYDNESINWAMDGLTSRKDRNLVTGGLAYVDKNWCLEGAYGYQTWKLDRRETLTENHKLHRFTLSFSIHY